MNILKAGQTLGEQLAGRWRCSTLPPVADYMEMWVPIFYFLHQGASSVSVLILVPLSCLFRLMFTMQFSPNPSFSPQKCLWGFHTDQVLTEDAVNAYMHAGAPPCLHHSEYFSCDLPQSLGCTEFYIVF